MSGILVVGSLNMDLVINTEKVPVMGETVLGNGFMNTPGGKGANQAVSASRSGADVEMIGCVGKDIFGNKLIQNLEVNGVNTDSVKPVKDIATGVAMIVVKKGDNFIIVDPGANSYLTPDVVTSFEEKIKKCEILVVQLEIPFETVQTAVRLAIKHNKKVFLNPAPARKITDDFLKNIDVITPNETECEIITGINVGSIKDAEHVIYHLTDKGVKQVVVTLGAKGCVYNYKNQLIHKPAPNVKTVDTTAAGDAFTGALAAAMLQNRTINEAVNFACAAGALTVTKRGAQASLPYLKDIKLLLSSQCFNRWH